MASLDTKESHEYVESTMGPSITQVAEFTPVKQNRKRNHSSPVHGSAKKVKEDVACESSSSDKMSSLSEPVSNELHPVNSDLKALLSKLSTDICAMNVSINNRIDQLWALTKFLMKFLRMTCLSPFCILYSVYVMKLVWSHQCGVRIS
ncbi:hypothetical protein DPMN_128682 [Dreissena polymorpha]|uniref:Uncharacterized protein n=1 Tax=Dreissena polymorpha TaxID=45954 RepID=A0A9D4GZY7_DREPO|nr:hypothetical protein DPMN_128682 [Dreissena polymorpha]